MKIHDIFIKYEDLIISNFIIHSSVLLIQDYELKNCLQIIRIVDNIYLEKCVM